MIKTKDNAIFLHRFLYSIASLTIKVFLPIIIYQQTGDIKLAVLFAAIQYIFSGLFTILLKNFLVKKQLISILISILPLIAIQIIISFVNINLVLVILLSIFAGITNPLYFIPLNIYFVKKDIINNVAKFEVGSVVGKVAFVILNGYILGSTLNNSLLIICSFSATLFLISIIPLILHFKEINIELKESKLISLVNINKQLTKHNLFHLFFGLFSQALYDILPLYLFYSQLSVEGVAYVVAITEILKIATYYFANYLNYKNLNLVNYLIGCLVILTSSILIIVSTSPILLFIIGTILGITSPFVYVPAFGNYCKKIGLNSIVSEGLILRDFYVLFPRGVIFSMFCLLPSFPIMFSIGALSAVAMFLTRIDSKNQIIKKELK
jgi:hypothetical protein